MKSRPGQKIKLTSVAELLGVVNEESAMDLEIAKIRPFKNHPFKVVDDERMQDLVESIRINGILSPTLVRPLGNDSYEMVSGHRRMHAAIALGMERIPAMQLSSDQHQLPGSTVAAHPCSAQSRHSPPEIASSSSRESSFSSASRSCVSSAQSRSAIGASTPASFSSAVSAA